MRNEKTTISLGFKSNLTDLTRVGDKVDWLKSRFDQLTRSVTGMGQVAGEGLRRFVNAPSGHLPGPGSRMSPWQEALARRNQATGLSQPAPRITPEQRGINLFGMGGMRRVAGGGMRGAFAAGGALGLALSAAGAISKGVTLAKAYNDALSPLNKQLSLLNGGQSEFTANISQTAVALGIARAELLQYTKAYVGQAGAQGGRVGRQVKDIGYFAKGMGMDRGTTYAQMGGLAQAGAFGALGGMGTKQFAAVVADAVARGNMKGREGELLSSINSLVNVQLQTLTRPGGTPGMINFMTGMNRTGQAGLMGARGAGVMSRVNQGIMNPGAGDFGEMFMYNALGGGNFYDFKMRQEEGAFGPNQNFLRVMGNMRQSYPNSRARWYAMSKLFPGLSMHQARGLEGALGKMGSGGSGFLDALRGAAGGNIESISTENYGVLADLYSAKDGQARMKVLRDSRLGLGGKFTANSSLEDMMRAVAGKNMIQTPEDKVNSQLASINQFLENQGMKAISLFSGTYAGVSKVVRHLDKHWGALEDGARSRAGIALVGERSAINPNLDVATPNTTADGKKVKISEGVYPDFDVAAFMEANSALKQASVNLNMAADKISGTGAYYPPAAGDGTGKNN